MLKIKIYYFHFWTFQLLLWLCWMLRESRFPPGRLYEKHIWWWPTRLFFRVLGMGYFCLKIRPASQKPKFLPLSKLQCEQASFICSAFHNNLGLSAGRQINAFSTW